MSNMTNNSTTTTNGMETNISSLDACLDFYYESGSSRHRDEELIVKKFLSAFEEDQLLALRILFNARDVREGKGERKVFISIIKMLADRFPEALTKNVSLIPSFGRWKDILVLFNTHLEDVAVEVIAAGLQDKATRGLCAKWIPIQGAQAVKIRRALKIKTPKEFRKLIVSLRSEAGVVEQKMCAKEWDLINYSHVPSLAINNYRKTFYAQDEARYKEFLEGLKTGKTKVNAGAIYPYQIIAPYLSSDPVEDGLIEAQWKALPNYLENSKERILPIIDTSGSMIRGGSKFNPILIAISLGMYIAERNEGIFKDAFITFNTTPSMLSIAGNTLAERVDNIQSAPWGGTTNFELSFDLILNAAIKHNLPEEEMPTMVLALSDMQFNQAESGKGTAFARIREKYKASGYKMPKLVFWNVVTDGSNFPVTKNEEDAAMISGFSPSVIRDVLSADLEKFTPMNMMLSIVNADRYKSIQI